MAKKQRDTFAKREKERARREKQEAKRARRQGLRDPDAAAREASLPLVTSDDDAANVDDRAEDREARSAVSGG
jgi:hypothetical protein